MKYNYISKAKKEYLGLLESGMFFEFYPKLTGDWEKDGEEWKEHYSKLSKFRKLYKQFDLKDSTIQDFYSWVTNRDKTILDIFSWKK